MLTLKEIKKSNIPFAELDEETKEYLYDTFKRYVVRKQIADTNKELTSLFMRRFGNNPREFARCFNEFNSRFVNANLIRELEYDEIHTDYLKSLSEDAFNYHLQRTGGSFERKIALMCFSMRPSERIANRVTFPVMVAYANMQTAVLEMANRKPTVSLETIFKDAAAMIREEFVQTNGYKINQSEIAEKREDYKALGKKAAPIWREMIEFYKKGLLDFEALEAAAFVRENFVFTSRELKYADGIFEECLRTAYNKVSEDRARAELDMEENPDTYIPADYDEVMSKRYAEEIYSDVMNKGIGSIFAKILADPIYAEKEPKKKGE